jgi:hypothetical protein
MLGPDSSQSTQTTWSWDVTNQTNDNHWWGFNDGDWLNDLLLVHLRTHTLYLTYDVCHTCLVTHEGGEMAWLLDIILGEGLDLTLMPAALLLWKETEISVTMGVILPV